MAELAPDEFLMLLTEKRSLRSMWAAILPLLVWITGTDDFNGDNKTDLLC